VVVVELAVPRIAPRCTSAKTTQTTPARSIAATTTANLSLTGRVASTTDRTVKSLEASTGGITKIKGTVANTTKEWSAAADTRKTTTSKTITEAISLTCLLSDSMAKKILTTNRPDAEAALEEVGTP